MLKKLLATLSAVTIASMSFASMSASAISISNITSDEYDFTQDRTTYYYDETGETVPLYHHLYFTIDESVTDCPSGIYYSYLTDKDGNICYTAVKVTANDSVDKDKLSELLGNENAFFDEIKEDNQYYYAYSADIDFDAIYAIEGVEKVELVRTTEGSKWYNAVGTNSNDTWWEEQNISTNGLAMSFVYTEDGVTLTEDSFANTGCDVVHVYQDSALSEKYDAEVWRVYYEYTGKEAVINFDKNAVEIDGVTASRLHTMDLEDAISGGYIADEVENTNATTTEITTATTEAETTTVTKTVESVKYPTSEDYDFCNTYTTYYHDETGERVHYIMMFTII